MQTPTAKLHSATLRRLAVAGRVDPRTIQRVVAGLPVKGDAGVRARQALAEAGIPFTVRDAGDHGGLP